MSDKRLKPYIDYKDLIGTLQVSEENYDIIENKLVLYKNIAIGSLNKVPFWRVQMLIEDWKEDVERQKEEQRKREKEMEARSKSQQSESKRNQNQMAKKYKM